MKIITRTLALLTITILTSGCAASRSVVHINQSASSIENPKKGTAVKIIDVSDNRLFEVAPKRPEIPSLKNGEKDIKNSLLKARAIGRKRNGYGMALGDVLLPENETVSSIIRETLTNGLRKANYRVLTHEDEGYNKAIPLKAKIIKFWSWLELGMWTIKVHNTSEVKLSGKLPALKKGLTIRGNVDKATALVTDSDWKEATERGLRHLSDDLIEKLDK